MRRRRERALGHRGQLCGLMRLCVCYSSSRRRWSSVSLSRKIGRLALEDSMPFDFLCQGQELSCVFSGDSTLYWLRAYRYVHLLGVQARGCLGIPRQEVIMMIMSIMGPSSPTFLSTHAWKRSCLCCARSKCKRECHCCPMLSSICASTFGGNCTLWMACTAARVLHFPPRS